MDSAHVCLVSVNLSSDGFDRYKCDRAVTLGMDMDSLSKVIRCSSNNDIITMSSDGANPDTVKFTFEAKDQVPDVYCECIKY